MGSMKPDWLAQMAPAHAPPAAGWWPLAWGWWVLIVLSAVALAVLVYRFTRPAQQLRRAALRELRQMENDIHDDNELARRLENLLRRYALQRYGTASVAHLTGSGWIDFIATRHGSALAGQSGADFLAAAWGKPVSGQRSQWLNGARDFIRKNKS